LTIETTLRTMVDVWMGDRDVTDAVGGGQIALEGAPELTRAFPKMAAPEPLRQGGTRR
jgi:hypothetical protein